ncbi:alpha/beta hydrolase family protein [Nocardiopsis suaedae]|uniref:Alpha/beta fold hydrolase n=1 Tax=Nocardiopsis suaedae TaxID=3018444 RepID=A0ABT4TUB4_9ACTN|nr:alpha/beta fold hydrolase [Nocardiopsis suaedae]MDA2808285.1 alpha/beta fold hydrolase [Nocardiopsis suaedae]
MPSRSSAAPPSSPVRAAAVAAAAVLLAAGCGPGGGAGAAPPGAEPVERDVSFRSGPDTLHGTFALPPDADGPVPGVLIISGSGPTDRDGNGEGRPDADTNLNFARVLARAGAASLRYDKLGSGETGMGSRGEEEAVGFDDFEAQMAAAYTELAEQPEVDPSRLLVLGHSEGALFALRSPGAVEGPAPAGLVLAAPPGNRYMDLIDRQITDQTRRAESMGAMTASDAEELLSDTRLAIARLRADEEPPSEMAPTVAPLFGEQNAEFLREIDALDPKEMAEELPGETPALVLWGTEDSQVQGAEVDRLMEGLESGGRTGVERVDIKGADHVFREYDDSPGAVIPDAERPFADEVAPAVESFLDEATG